MVSAMPARLARPSPLSRRELLFMPTVVARSSARVIVNFPTLERKAMTTTTTELRPHAGFEVTVTRPDGVLYPAFLQRFDGPRGGVAILYVEPANCPDDMQPYQQEVYVEELAEGGKVHRLSYSAEQAEHVREWARQVLNAT